MSGDFSQSVEILMTPQVGDDQSSPYVLTFNVEPVNWDLDAVVDKLGKVREEHLRAPAGRKAAGRRMEKPATRRQMPRVGVRTRWKRAR